MKKLLVLLLLFMLILSGCGNDADSSNDSSEKEIIKIASLIPPMTEILELTKPQLLEEGIELEVVVLGDNVQPNVALATKEVDANFFNMYHTWSNIIEQMMQI